MFTQRRPLSYYVWTLYLYGMVLLDVGRNKPPRRCYGVFGKLELWGAEG